MAEAALAPDKPAFADPNSEPPAPHKQAEDWGKGLFKEDGSFDHTALDKAPDDLKPLAKDLSRYKTRDEFLRAFGERGQLMAKKGIMEPPGKDATDKERSDYKEMVRKANGTPAKPEDYGIKRPDGIPEQYWDGKWAEAAAKIMHEEGVSPSAAKRLFEEGMKNTQTSLANKQKEQTAVLEEQDRLIRETLIKEGMDFPKGLEDAQRAARKFGLDPESPFLKNASIFMVLSRMGRNLKEDVLIQGATETLSSMENLTTEAAGKRAESIARNPKDPLYGAYWNKDEKGKAFDHPDHESTVALVRKLNAKYREGMSAARR